MRKLKRYLAAGLVITSLVSGCASNDKNGASEDTKQEAKEVTQKKAPEEGTTDKAFFDSLETGLKARWKLADGSNDEDQFGVEWKKYPEAELEQIEEFTDKEFEDSDLKKLADNYIETLKTQCEALDLAEADYLNSNLRYDDTVVDRMNILRQMNQEYGFTVEDDEDQNFEQIIVEPEKDQSVFDKLIKGITVTEDTDDAGNKILKLNGTNHSEVTVKNLDFKVEFESRDGKELETLNSEKIPEVAPGEDYSVVVKIKDPSKLEDLKDMRVILTGYWQYQK